jgi:LysR family transcriptional regulator, nitrogen assimilation regulatory protein
LELRDLRVLSAVVEAGGVTRASAGLNLVQSAVSQAIARLERELGVELLHRRPDGVEPTAAGRELVRYAAELLETAARAERAMAAYREQAQGTLRVGMLQSLTPLVLGDLLRRLKRSCPEVAVEVTEGLRGELLGGVRRHSLDLAVVWVDPDESSLPVEIASSIALVAVAAPDHRLAAGEPVAMSALAGERWVSFPRGGPGYRWIRDAATDAGFEPTVEAVVETYAELIAFVEAGLGITLMPAPVVAERAEAGTIALLEVVDPTPRAAFGWMADAGRDTPQLRAACEALRAIAVSLGER